MKRPSSPSIPCFLPGALSWACVLTAPLVFAQEDSDAEIAKKLNNPVASIISVPFQANWDFGSGPSGDGTQFKLNFQPVVPVDINDDWKVIIRTIVPFISQEDVYKPAGFSTLPFDRHQDGLGDIAQTFFFSPKHALPEEYHFGIGPIVTYPTATDDVLGGEKWLAGPAVLFLRQSNGWTAGFLANHQWSFAGDDKRNDVSVTNIQPFINYQTKTHTTIGVNAESIYDWETSQWTVPVNATITQLVRIGKMPVSLQVGGRYYAEGPSGAPEWGLRATVTLVLPEGKASAPAPHDGKSYAK